MRAFNQNFLTFNSLNSYILKGDAAQGMELTFTTLMARALDEPDSFYGLAARAVRISDDGLTYRFTMRPGIKFHDGSPITAHDSAFSLKILKEKGHPIAQQLLRDCVSAEATDDATVVVKFAPNRARDVPLFVVSLPIFSRTYYATRPFDEMTLEPLPARAYKVGCLRSAFHRIHRGSPEGGTDLPVPAGEQFRRPALRVPSRPRRRLKVHRQEHCSRGAHFASGRRATTSPPSATAA